LLLLLHGVLAAVAGDSLMRSGIAAMIWLASVII